MKATLPRELEIDGVVHVQHYRDENFAIYQSYSGTTPPSNDPLIAPGGIPEGQNLFHVFRIEHNSGGEGLGELLGTFSDLHPAIERARQEATAQ